MTSNTKVRYQINDRIYVRMRYKNKDLEESAYMASHTVLACAYISKAEDIKAWRKHDSYVPAKVVMHVDRLIMVMLEDGELATFDIGNCKPVISKNKPLILLEEKHNDHNDDYKDQLLAYKNNHIAWMWVINLFWVCISLVLMFWNFGK